MIKLLVDESSGSKLCRFLTEKGFDVKFVTDIIPGASDERILELAEKEERILITNDKDFGELIYRMNKPSSGVILIRLKMDLPENRQKNILNLIRLYGKRLKSSFVVITEGKLRIRKI